MDGDHRLPDWFIACNTVLGADVDKLDPKVEIAPPSAEDNDTEKPGDGVDHDPTEVPDNALLAQISPDDFSLLRDTTAAAFTRNSRGVLEPLQSVVSIYSKSAEPEHFLDEVVKLLAKDMRVSLISFGLEDLLDLGLEFSSQSPDDASRSSSTNDEELKSDLAKHWFTSSSNEEDDPDAFQRCQKSLSTLLDAIPKGQLGANRGATENTQEHNPSDGYVLVHVREALTMLAVDRGHRFISRLGHCVEQRRQGGQNIVIVVTIPSLASSNGDCPCPDCKTQEFDWTFFWEYTSATALTTVGISPLNINPGSCFTHIDTINSVNTKRMKRILRKRFHHLFAPDILRPDSDWSKLLCRDHEHCFAQGLWDWEDICRACIQISGRSWGRQQIEPKDILLVLSRLGLHKHVQPVEPSGQEPQELEAESDPPKSADKGTEQTWEDKIKAVRKDCRSREKSLLPNVVDPDKLQSSYSQVIINEDLKETVLHLVSSSYLGPATTNGSLLSQVRLRGIMLYGPPGTGKTHLTRAIAKESGAAMLSVDAATLVSKYVGETEKSISAAFSLASKLSPCVLFIDEVDALFYDRKTAMRSWERSPVTQFLTEMDGLVDNANAPCVVVATNRPDVLDSAFLRRLPQKVPVGLPDLEARSKILELFLEGEELEPLVDIGSLAREADGYSGSDLRSLCAEAALLWAIEQSKKSRVNRTSETSEKMRLGLTHFARAFQKIRPSVSKADVDDLAEFTRRFNPNAIE
ncbi:ATPase family AAA domain-containing 1-A [Fusarium albosuccineum]|uniref:ATPase family AAA domain-containing 1-A n=1 Tax=Fusarium albosuccineum TaxID=1237068 RepID=A0A8H4LA08_9HYPO|nr:ATPase family AAA domain-containing 1-A [Fusarium albosuccineum]